MLHSVPQADPAAPLRAAACGWASEARAVLARLNDAVAAEEAALQAGADPARAAVAMDRLLERLAAAQAALPGLAA